MLYCSETHLPRDRTTAPQRQAQPVYDPVFTRPNWIDSYSEWLDNGAPLTSDGNMDAVVEADISSDDAASATGMQDEGAAHDVGTTFDADPSTSGPGRPSSYRPPGPFADELGIELDLFGYPHPDGTEQEE